MSPKPRTDPRRSKLAYALLGLSWALQEGLAGSNAWQEKLTVPNSELISALTALSVRERQELISEIRQFAARHSWPGPLTVDEVCLALDKMIPRARKRT